MSFYFRSLRQRKEEKNRICHCEENMTLDPSITVKELLDQYPTTIGVFIRHKMFCVGCATQAYHTLRDVAGIYGLTLNTLMDSLQNTILAGDEL